LIDGASIPRLIYGAGYSMEQLTEKQHFWQQHVLQAQSHNGSLADYAKQHQLKANTLYYWVGIFKRTAAQPEKLAIMPMNFRG